MNLKCNIYFFYIFRGRPTFLELLEFCEETLNICKQFLLLPPRFKERIGGLYLLYGIYYKMPIDQFKIRVKLDDWQNIMELHAEIKEAEHLDANYILCKLIVDNAFHFCIFDSEVYIMKILILIYIILYINENIIYNLLFPVWIGKTISCKECTMF